MNAIERWLLTVLSAIHADHCIDFAGLGLVFYADRNALPVHPLVSTDCEVHVPAKTLQESIELIKRISRRTSVCHDGFHLVDAASLHITDLSQFLSPPIPAKPLTLERTGGARHMAARLISLLPSVSLSAVCTLGSEVTVYEQGASRTLRIHPLTGSRVSQ